jgi:hypothetical protein
VRAFPRNLAGVTIKRWDNLVGGDYTTPPRPPDRLLIELLEVLYLAAAMPEEARYPQFNIVAVPLSEGQDSSIGDIWSFDRPRSLSVDEVRRLAPAVDSKKSAILVCWSDLGWQISGLVDLGTSWSRARIGLQYHYHSPPYLFVQVDQPGRMRVYQGRYIVAALRDGRLERHKGIEITMALGTPVQNGLRKLWNKISYPKLEEPREFENFQYLAFWNTLAALANCIGDDAHGGAIIIVPNKRSITAELRIKYPQSSIVLQSAFIGFMNARHVVGDFITRFERNEKSLEGEYAIADLKLSEAHLRLVEAIRFVARLSGCDGAIVISEDLQVLGFGAEIRSELKPSTKVVEIIDDLRGISKSLDVEHFGLRHRSAIKLVSRKPAACVLVVSQDGPISVVSSDLPGQVKVRKGVNLTNLDMPFA